MGRQIFPVIGACSLILVSTLAEGQTEIILESAPLGSDLELRMDSYSCSSSLIGNEERRIGQVINNEYAEWLETYRTVDGRIKTLCIKLLIPVQVDLDKEDARSHLNSSLAYTEIKAQRRSSSESETLPDWMRNAKPMPMPRATGLDEGEIDNLKGLRSSASNKTSKESFSSSPLKRIHIIRGLTESGPDETTSSRGHYPPDESLESWSSPDKKDGKSVDKEQSEGKEVKPVIGSSSDFFREGKQSTGNVDERQRVTNTTSYPYSIIAKLYSEYNNGEFLTSCTGTLVSPYVVITAGHCLHSRDRGGFLTGSAVVPGQVQTSFTSAPTAPFGILSPSYVAASERWKTISGGSSRPVLDFRFDYGALFLEEGATYTSTFMPILYDDTRTFVNNAGYPGAVQGQFGNEGMWFDSGAETNLSQNVLRSFQLREFEIDSSEGNSGGPLWAYDGEQRFLVGILTSGRTDTTLGPWIGGANEDTIRNWASWTPDQSTVPNSGYRTGLRITGVSAGATPGERSYLRFFNRSAESASATVRIYNFYDGTEVGVVVTAEIPSHASYQYEITEFESIAGIEGAEGDYYALAIEPSFDGFFQHVYWNDVGQSLTNITGCATGASNNNSVILNFHTSNLSEGYPSTALFHNVGSEPSDLVMNVYDAVTGEEIGSLQYIGQVQPDEAVGFQSEGLDSILFDLYGHEPTSQQYHYNIEIIGEFSGYAQHYVENVGSGVTTNMSTTCDLVAE